MAATHPPPRLEHALADAVANGVPLNVAARALGYPPRKVKKWVELARAGRAEFEQFGESIDAARTERAHDVAELLAQLRDRVGPPA